MNAPTTPRKPLVVGWLYEGIVPPVFTDSVVIYREWLRQGHANVSPVIRKSDADAYYIPHGEVRVECAPDPRGIGIGAWVGSRCIYSGIHEIPAKTRDWAAINAAIDEYLDGYELRVDEGCHTPTEFERFLILDAVAGLLAEEKILALLSCSPASVAPGDAQDDRLYQWPTTTARMKALAAELIFAANSMGGGGNDGEDVELVLSVAPAGTILLDEDPDVWNPGSLLTVHTKEYPDAGRYLVDPAQVSSDGTQCLAPTAGEAPPRFTISASDRFELTGAVGLLRGCGYVGPAAALQRVLDAESASFSVQGEDDARDADMYWNDADTEGFAGTTLDDAVRYVADDIPTSEMPVTLTFQCAKTLPNVQVLVTGVDGDGDLQYEVIDAAQQGKGGEA